MKTLPFDWTATAALLQAIFCLPLREKLRTG